MIINKFIEILNEMPQNAEAGFVLHDTSGGIQKIIQIEKENIVAIEKQPVRYMSIRNYDELRFGPLHKQESAALTKFYGPKIEDPPPPPDITLERIRECRELK